MSDLSPAAGTAGSAPFAPHQRDPVAAANPRPSLQPRAGRPRPDLPAPPVPETAPPPGEAGLEVRGRIHIADEVVEKVAGLAAMEVEGVADLGGGPPRAVEGGREGVGRAGTGVEAEVKGHEVAVSVRIVVAFGHVVLDVARHVQRNVARKAQRMLGLQVTEVNVTVDDVLVARPEPRPEAPAAPG